MARERPGVDLADLERVVTSQADFFRLGDKYTQLLRNPGIQKALDIAGLPAEGFGDLVSVHRGWTLYQNLGPDFLRVAQAVRPDIFRDPTPGTMNYDARTEKPSDSWTGIAANLLRDPTLANNFVTAVESRAQATTNEVLSRIDQDVRSNTPTKVDVIVVGEGPIAAHVTSQLGPIYGGGLVVMTSSPTLMGPWAERGLYLNSSSRDAEVNAPVIGDTTPVFAAGARGVRVADLVGETLRPLRVKCDDGSTREYPPAQALALAKTVNLVANASQFVLGADVELDRITPSRSRPGYNEVPFRDKSGRLRILSARQVFLATGPGVDGPRIPSSPFGSNQVERASKNMRTQVSKLEEKYRRRQALMAMAESASGSPEAEMFSDQAQTIRVDEPLILPRILTLRTVEDALAAWRKYQNGDLSLNPLNPLFDSSVDIGVVGAQDGARTWIERLRMEGPVSGRPEFGTAGQPRIRVYGLETQFSEDSRVRQKTYADEARVRYLRSLRGTGVTATRGRVDRLNLDDNGRPVVEYTPIDRTLKRSHDYVFIATGLTATNYRFDYFGRTTDLTGPGGERLATVLSPGVIVLGSANQFSAEQLPGPLRTILREIGIQENSVSLWVNAILANRAVLETQTRQTIESPYLTRLAQVYAGGMKVTAGEVLADVGKGEALIRMYGETPEKPTLPDALNAQVGTIALAALGLTRSRFLPESFGPKEISSEIEFGPKYFTEPNSIFPKTESTRTFFSNIDLGGFEKFKKQNNIK